MAASIPPDSSEFSGTAADGMDPHLLTLRLIAALGQEALARLCSAHPSTVRRWARGTSKPSREASGRLRLAALVAELIPFVEAQRSIAEWLVLPNSILGGEPPLTALTNQDLGLLAWDWVEAAATEWAFGGLLSSRSTPTEQANEPRPPATKSDAPKSEHPVEHRTLGEAKALLPEARAVVDEVSRRLPTDSFAVSPATTFVSTTMQKETAIFALTFLGTPRHLSAVPFELGSKFEDTVQAIVDAALRFKERAEAEQLDLPDQGGAST